MVRVMLINPPQRYYSESMRFGVYVPIGLLSVAAMIKDICDLKIFDGFAFGRKQKQKEGFLYGVPTQEIEASVRDFNPDIVGISVPFSTQLESAVRIARLCKRIDPSIKIVLGGPDISARYRHILESDYCDFCVVGEGEETFYEFIKRYDSDLSMQGIKGLACRMHNKICYEPRACIEDLDTLPLPAYEFVDLRDYFRNHYLYKNRSIIYKNSLSIVTSRGCPYNCIFCSVSSHMGSRFRAHSPDYVIRHLQQCIRNYGIRRFHFEDDNISLDKRRFELILDKIIENNMNIEWDVPNGIRVDTLDYLLLKKMKRSGCKSLSIGIESGNQEVRTTIIRKNISLNSILAIARYCRELTINLIAFYVIGFPGETKKNIQETINLALKLFNHYNVIPALHFATPLYGTELYRICSENNLIPNAMSDNDYSKATQYYGNPLILTGEFNKKELTAIIRGYIIKHRMAHMRQSMRLCMHLVGRIKVALLNMVTRSLSFSP